MNFTIKKSKTDGICGGCKYSQVVHFGNRLLVRCEKMRTNLRYPVTDCSAHYPRGIADKGEMEDVAWLLRTDKKGKSVGFVRPGDRGYDNIRWGT